MKTTRVLLTATTCTILVDYWWLSWSGVMTTTSCGLFAQQMAISPECNGLVLCHASQLCNSNEDLVCSIYPNPCSSERPYQICRRSNGVDTNTKEAAANLFPRQENTRPQENANTWVSRPRTVSAAPDAEAQGRYNHALADTPSVSQ